MPAPAPQLRYIRTMRVVMGEPRMFMLEAEEQVTALQPWQCLWVAFDGQPDMAEAKLKDAMSQLQRQRRRGLQLEPQQQRLFEVVSERLGQGGSK